MHQSRVNLCGKIQVKASRQSRMCPCIRAA